MRLLGCQLLDSFRRQREDSLFGVDAGLEEGLGRGEGFGGFEVGREQELEDRAGFAKRGASFCAIRPASRLKLLVSEGVICRPSPRVWPPQ